MTTDTVSPEEIESTRMYGASNAAVLLRAREHVTQEHAGALMGVSASTISRNFAELQQQMHLLAAYGFILVPVGSVVAPPGSMVVDPAELTALESMALKYLETRQQQRLKGA